MFSRADYMADKCSFEQYYNQFVTLGRMQAVVYQIGLNKILKSKDEHLNDIPLKKWDNIFFVDSVSKDLEKHGDYLTLAGKVCIAKACAKQIKKNYSTT